MSEFAPANTEHAPQRIRRLHIIVSSFLHHFTLGNLFVSGSLGPAWAKMLFRMVCDRSGQKHALLTCMHLRMVCQDFGWGSTWRYDTVCRS